MSKYTKISFACIVAMQAMNTNAFSSFIIHEKGFKENQIAGEFIDKEDLLKVETKQSQVEEKGQGAVYAVSLEETLYLRRISSYWKERRYNEAKKEILSFLRVFPQNAVKDSLFAMLGDLYFQEKNYAEALSAYKEIAKTEYKERCFLNEIRALFELKEYEAVSTNGSLFLISKNLDKNTENRLQFLCAESFYSLAKKAEVKEVFAKEAVALYQKLENTKYEDASLYPLAELYTILEEPKRAAEAYIKLAEKFPSKQEDLLFIAATLELKYSKEQAANTFAKISTLKGKKSAAASYNFLTLLFDEKEYTRILEVKEEILPLIAEEQKPLAEWFIGWSYYEAEDFKNAAPYLFAFASSQKEESPSLKTALLSLVNCAEKENNLPLFDGALSLLRTHYEQDEVFAKVLMNHAEILSSSNEKQRAKEALKELLSRFPNAEEKEMATYNLANLLFENKEWEESRETFISYLKEQSTSEHTKAAFRQFLYCSIQESKQPNAQKKENFASDLEWVLSQKDVLNENEQKDYSFVQAKILYELKNFSQAESKLENCFQAFPEFENVAEAHLLMAMCKKKNEGKIDLFIQEAEKALELKPDVVGHISLRLQLFNAYVSLNEPKFLELGAKHLHAVSLLSPIKPENRLWLANFYYGKTKSDPSEAITLRAIEHFEHLLSSISPLTETEALKLATLYQKSGQIEKQISLLTKLNELQKSAVEDGWKYQRQTLFELAKAYETHKDLKNALPLYESLADLKIGASFISQAALLQKARVKYALLEDAKKNEADLDYKEVLHILKNIELAKNLSSEPLHVEAALDYAGIVASVTESQVENYLGELKKIREDFSSEENPFVKDYYSIKEQYPQKELLVKNYMRFIEAEILRNEALLGKQAGKEEYAKELQEQALAQLEGLLGQDSLSFELKTRIEKSMEALK